MGYFDLVCKILKDESGKPKGAFSEFLMNLKHNDKFRITGKDYAYRYLGYGKFIFKSQEGVVEEVNGVEDAIMLVENTNISTFFQFVDMLANFGPDTTSIYMLYQVDNLRKAALMDELHALLDMGKIGLECFEEPKSEATPSAIPESILEQYIIHARKQFFLISGSADFYREITRKQQGTARDAWGDAIPHKTTVNN